MLKQKPRDLEQAHETYLQRHDYAQLLQLGEPLLPHVHDALQALAELLLLGEPVLPHLHEDL